MLFQLEALELRFIHPLGVGLTRGTEGSGPGGAARTLGQLGRSGWISRNSNRAAAPGAAGGAGG